MPISGEIVEVNESVVDNPEQVNGDPMDGGWLLKIKIADTSELDNLLSAKDYEALLGG